VFGKVEGLVVRKLIKIEDALFEEVMLNELFQVLSEGPTMNDFVTFRFVIGAVFFRLRKQGIILD